MQPMPPPASALPAQAELAALVTLFQQGKLGEAHDAALAMTARFPQAAAGWKILAATLQQLGRGADALAPIQRALALQPGDAGAHNIHSLALKALGQLAQAEAGLRYALRLSPQAPDLHSNLGNTLLELGRLDEAEASLRQALVHKDDFADAHCNLGICLFRQRRLDEARACYQRALALAPQHAGAHFHAGLLLKDGGQLEPAVASLERALALRPNWADVHYNLGVLYSYCGKAEAEREAYRRALAAAPAGIGLYAATLLAVHHYLAGQDQDSARMLDLARPVLSHAEGDASTSQAYWRLLDRLLAWQAGRPAASSALPTLHVIGESHCLPAHRTAVAWRGQHWRCQSHWIIGCKQWHLGKDRTSIYRRRFDDCLAALPAASSVLLVVGEIDCRPDEGILKAWRRDPGRTLGELCLATVAPYVAQVRLASERHGHAIVLAGVPASNAAALGLSPEMAQQHRAVLIEFNAVLHDQARQANIDFLDLYAMTDSGGAADGRWHIDNYHLTPEATAQAFAHHCRRYGH